jgi:hypothetical protein
LSHFDVRSSAIFAEPRARHASAIAGGFARTTDRAPRCCCGSISSLWFSNLHFAPCVLGRVRHAPLRPSRFTPVRPGHASRSLFGATFRYPCFVEPYHNRAAHPHCICRADHAATLLGFSHPSQCSPSAGPGVRDATRSSSRVHLRRSSPPAVIEFTSRRLFLQLSVVRVSLSLLNKLLPHERVRQNLARDRLRCDSTGCWVLLPQTSRAGPCLRSRPANPAMGFGFFFRAYRMLFHSTSPRAPALARRELCG